MLLMNDKRLDIGDGLVPCKCQCAGHFRSAGRAKIVMDAGNKDGKERKRSLVLLRF